MWLTQARHMVRQLMGCQRTGSLKLKIFRKIMPALYPMKLFPFIGHRNHSFPCDCTSRNRWICWRGSLCIYKRRSKDGWISDRWINTFTNKRVFFKTGHGNSKSSGLQRVVKCHASRRLLQRRWLYVTRMNYSTCALEI